MKYDENNFAKNLAAYRAKRNLSQKQLADLMGCSLWAAHHWESNGRSPSLRSLCSISEKLGVQPLAWLVSPEENGLVASTMDAIRDEFRDSIDRLRIRELESKLRDAVALIDDLENPIVADEDDDPPLHLATVGWFSR